MKSIAFFFFCKQGQCLQTAYDKSCLAHVTCCLQNPRAQGPLFVILLLAVRGSNWGQLVGYILGVPEEAS